MLKIGFLGAGKLGRVHIRTVKELKSEFEIIGFFDPSDENALLTEKEFGLKRYTTKEDLIAEVECVDIVSSTNSHYENAAFAIRNSKHVFIEKPVTETTEEAKSLMNLAHEAGVKVQVGHLERFNPAFQEALLHFSNPMFIETHRLTNFDLSGNNQPVVLDLMIHDLDIILSVVNSPVKRISASGIAVVSDTADIANARLEFENGCVANLTASRISMKNMRKSRFFQKDAYISVDFLDKTLEVIQMENTNGKAQATDMIIDLGEGKPSKKLLFNKPEIKDVNLIKEELKAFAQSINTNAVTKVTLEDGYTALAVATLIQEKLKLSGNLVTENK